jgi:hypothetical protein
MSGIFDDVDVNPVFKFQEMINQTALATELVIKHPRTRELLKSDATFDLVISELALNEGLLGFSEHYKCPHILISTVASTSWIEKLTANPTPYSYVPHVFLDLTDRMTLLGRLQNTFFHVFEDIIMRFLHYPKQQKIYETAFPSSKNFRPFSDKMKNGVSMVRL